MTTNPAIVFIGFMGAGKSTALAQAPESLGRKVDLDKAIEEEARKSVSDLFKDRGESGFREIEERVALAVLESGDGGVIALGGGSVLSPRVREALKRHKAVWLDVSVDTAWERVAGKGDRPLAQEPEEFKRLFRERRRLYEEVADAVLLEVDEGLLPWAMGSLALLKDSPPGTKMILATSASDVYPVYVGRGLLRGGFYPLEHRVFCVTDTNVGPKYAKYISADEVYELAPGEIEKNLDSAQRIWTSMIEAGLTRHDKVVALGGGVIGDLAGFCAATFQRGMGVVQVPTTLVAQVDSAYGGKTGIDMSEAKNYVGAYHMPDAVITDVEALETLPHEELAAGFVEVLKTGLLAGEPLWDRIRAIEKIDPAGLDEIVFSCARYKCEVVAADERDSGLRHVLNLGHTIGHAIETASNYTHYRHGEAVGLGLLAVLALSEAPQLREEVRAILLRHDLPVHLDPDIALQAVLEALQRDKKRSARGVEFVLLSEPGEPRTGQLVDPAKVEAAVKELYA